MKTSSVLVNLVWRIKDCLLCKSDEHSHSELEGLPKGCCCLTHLMPVFYFYALWKHQKSRGFLMLSKDIEIEHWSEIDLIWWMQFLMISKYRRRILRPWETSMMEIFLQKLSTPLVIHVSQSHIIKVTLSKPPVFAISAYNATLSKDFLKSKIGKDSTFEGKIMTVLQSHLNLR